MRIAKGERTQGDIRGAHDKFYPTCRFWNSATASAKIAIV